MMIPTKGENFLCSNDTNTSREESVIDYQISFKIWFFLNKLHS